MTPERLSGPLRTDPASVLARFSLFVVDEAHLLSKGDRGWRLEESLSTLEYLAKEDEHRIVLLSAALGNKAHVVSWIGQGEPVVERHEEWRAARRLHAIYTSTLDEANTVTVPGVGNRAERRVTPLFGDVYLRTGREQAAAGRFADPVGRLVRRRKRDGGWAVDATSTSQRLRLVPLIIHVSNAGPVLVVEPTRGSVTRLATELAREMPEHPPAFQLADLAAIRLGANHPLVRVLRRGVAFHHGALPADLQAEIEQTVRANCLRVLVATNTVTEGVNMLFKSVVVGSIGYGAGQDFVELIDPARLINAVGRAGRAGRETEGWMILADFRAFNLGRFDPLEKTAEDLTLESVIAQAESIQELARFEASVAENEDSIFEESVGITASFIAYVWFVAQAIELVRGNVPDKGDIEDALGATLAWQQLDDGLKARWLELAGRSFDAYLRQPAAVRRRWSRTGTSLPTSRVLDGLAATIAQTIQNHGLPLSIDDTLEFVLGEEDCTNFCNSRRIQPGVSSRARMHRERSISTSIFRPCCRTGLPARTLRKYLRLTLRA
jgi:Lhr-like helicase